MVFRLDEIKQARQERSRQVLALVNELGSVPAAAAHLGVSQQRVRQLIGPGAFRATIAVTCQDCGRATRVRRDAVPRCKRCRAYFAATGRPWTVAGAARKGAPRQTHCHQGHPLSGDNLYVAPSGARFCRTCARHRATQRRAAERAARQPAPRQQLRDRMRPDPPSLEVIEPAKLPTD